MERPFRGLFTTKVIKSHVKLQGKSDAQKLNWNCILATPTNKIKKLYAYCPTGLKDKIIKSEKLNVRERTPRLNNFGWRQPAHSMYTN